MHRVVDPDDHRNHILRQLETGALITTHVRTGRHTHAMLDGAEIDVPGVQELPLSLE